jgi:glycosyltransferase involved in cell wall biosynthesis
MKYLIISPTFNEEENIERTLLSVIKQSVLPQEWIIVNDGSTDRTEEIVKRYSEKHPWIKLYNFTKGDVAFGTHAVVNFYKGYEKITCKDWNFVVKLDTDLDIDSDTFFEYQLQKFEQNPKLGITSGITYSIIDGNKVLTQGRPKWRTGGAMKMYRRECLNDIEGLKPMYGWDGLDEYQAMYRGWITRTFFDLHVNHLGKARALNREKELWLIKARARSLYQRGYPFEFVLLKGAKMLLSSFHFGTSFLKEYIKVRRSETQRVVSREEKMFIRKFQYVRLLRKA